MYSTLLKGAASGLLLATTTSAVSIKDSGFRQVVLSNIVADLGADHGEDMSRLDRTIRGKLTASDPLLHISTSDGYLFESAPLLGAGGDADFSDSLGASGQLKINTNADSDLDI